jgi:hypothetical protein
MNRSVDARSLVRSINLEDGSYREDAGSLQVASGEHALCLVCTALRGGVLQYGEYIIGV